MEDLTKYRRIRLLWLTRDSNNRDLLITLPDGTVIKVVVETNVQIRVGIDAPRNIKVERPEREK